MKNIINLKEQKHTENKKWCYFSRKGLITSNILTLSFCFCIFTVDPIWFPCPTIIHKMKIQTLYCNIIIINTKSFCCIRLANFKFRSKIYFHKEPHVLVLLKRIKTDTINYMMTHIKYITLIMKNKISIFILFYFVNTKYQFIKR